jgi:hypothetical protein
LRVAAAALQGDLAGCHPGPDELGCLGLGYELNIKNRFFHGENFTY